MAQGQHANRASGTQLAVAYSALYMSSSFAAISGGIEATRYNHSRPSSANMMTSTRKKGRNVSRTRRSGATRVSLHVVGSFDGWVPIAGTARTARLDQVQAAAPCTPEESPAESWMPPSTTTNAPIQGRANYMPTCQKDDDLVRLCRVLLAIGPLALIAREPCCLLPCVCVWSVLGHHHYHLVIAFH